MSLQDTETPTRTQEAPRSVAYLASLLLVAAATLAAIVVDQALHAPNLSLVFVLPVVIAAVSFGWGPAITAAVAGVLAYNFFLIDPRYTLRVADPANVWALVLLLATAAIVSAVAAQARRRAIEAWDAAEQGAALKDLARELVGAADRRAIAEAGAEALSRLFRAPAVILVEGPEDLKIGGASGGARLSPADWEAARWTMAADLPTRGGGYPIEGSRLDFWPLVTPQRHRVVLGVEISEREQGRPDAPERLVETVGGYLSVALDREGYARQLLDSRVHTASDRVKADLLAAVSHDLKTPLSTILVTLQSLRRFADRHDPTARDQLLELAETETARLSGMVANLLDMSRLEAGALAVRPAPCPVRNLVAAAAGRAGHALAGRKLVNEVKAGAPALMVDASLFEAALGNVLENAAKYSPPGSTIRVRATHDGDLGGVEVLDEGPGFAGAVEPLFERFARGIEGDGRAPGTGLGLAIARGFVEAQGGRVEAGNRPKGLGAFVRLSAPLADAAPAR